MMFGLDFKSLIVGVLLAWFVIPFIQRTIAGRRAPAQANT